ncbi:unnamed protein product [Rangifer tarandus platyrhynchus]|uniref:Uncharacterized protein n=2 Tax=Rangifer tarandus platyrhynchus TaxID=3082113 RepID=A0ABN8Y1E4_RANTA|nr:unnamed protein product [Rangifer tarandus platyrhynchus]CAI9692447.1 unnamed protein product [Rangifer tarandus platyrhynchus]
MAWFSRWRLRTWKRVEPEFRPSALHRPYWEDGALSSLVSGVRAWVDRGPPLPPCVGSVNSTQLSLSPQGRRGWEVKVSVTSWDGQHRHSRRFSSLTPEDDFISNGIRTSAHVACCAHKSHFCGRGQVYLEELPQPALGALGKM